ncbi:MAG TPA: aminotransferase class I/II-fold pyridoxal phosphate-dependent enzyme, partial [Fimbriimonadaceae bacterium]|nr:aminotransferase class I/II-fold pyridoxal phosphate-dependent enzyme [Fimbriimonadaceae bacterium]
MDVGPKHAKDTLLQHLGEEQKHLGAVVPPIFQNSLFVFPDQASFTKAGADPLNNSSLYSRVGNPSLDVAEKKIAMLEGAERCKLVGSGMGAITASIMSTVESGSHVVIVDGCYGPVRDLITDYLARFGVTHTFVDGTCADDVIDATRPETTLVYLESPCSLIFRLQDVRAIAAAARERGVTTIIDNTYSTPLYQSPIEMGVDIVIHSASKYIGGHSDVIAGAICTSEKLMDRILRKEISLLGSILAPFPAWLITRGLRTLKLRLKAHEAAANEVAGWMEEQEWVGRVNHVGLRSFPQRDLYIRQMRGTGGLFSFEPAKQDQDACDTFVNSLKLFQLGVSWGGFESLVVQAT